MRTLVRLNLGDSKTKLLKNLQKKIEEITEPSNNVDYKYLFKFLFLKIFNFLRIMKI